MNFYVWNYVIDVKKMFSDQLHEALEPRNDYKPHKIDSNVRIADLCANRSCIHDFNNPKNHQFQTTIEITTFDTSKNVQFASMIKLWYQKSIRNSSVICHCWFLHLLKRFTQFKRCM